MFEGTKKSNQKKNKVHSQKLSVLLNIVMVIMILFVNQETII